MQDKFQVTPAECRHLMSLMFHNIHDELRRLLPNCNIREDATFTFDNNTGEIIQSYPPFPEHELYLNNFKGHFARGCRRVETKKYGWGTIEGELFQDMDFHGAWCATVHLDRGETYSFFINDLSIDHGH